jgi:hypothetical protein
MQDLTLLVLVQYVPVHTAVLRLMVWYYVVCYSCAGSCSLIQDLFSRTNALFHRLKALNARMVSMRFGNYHTRMSFKVET